jgi:DNA-binding NarL/FixJ family response regulator
MRVVVAEDSALLRDGLVHLLERHGHEVVAAVADADALLEAVAEHRPDIAVVDVRMPPTHTDDGLRAALALRRDHPDVALLVLSQYIETRYATQLLSGRCDGIGYLLKDRVADVSEFLDALVRVAGGATVLDPEVVTQILGASRRSNSAIAAALVVSPASVEKYVSGIFAKLGLPPSDADHRRVLAVLRYLGS